MAKKTHQTAHEIAKLGAGLILGDLIGLLWLYGYKILPINFLGLNFTSEMAVLAIIFDLFLFALLVHYAWNIKLPSPSIHQKAFFYFIGIMLSIVAVLHLTRLVFNLELVVGNWAAPLWLSWIGTIVTAYLAMASFKFASHK